MTTTHVHMIHPDALNHRRTARAYNDMPHYPEAPGVRATYAAFRAEILAQWERIVADGLTVEFHGGTHEYGSSAAMLDDVWRRQHLFTRHSALAGDTFEPAHPMAEIVATAPGRRLDLALNDIFRAVHDIRGHVDSSSGFGPEGEMRAWLQHRSTLSAAALPALWCETRGQAAWTNDFGDHRELPLSERPFADQKAGMPPEWAV